MAKRGRPKTLDDAINFTARIERAQKEKLECLAARLDTDPTSVLREFLDAGFEANPVTTDELAAWRKKKKRKEMTAGVPGLKRPRGAIARLVAVSATPLTSDAPEAEGMEKKGYGTRLLPAVAQAGPRMEATGGTVVNLDRRRAQAQKPPRLALRAGARGSSAQKRSRRSAA